MSEMKPASSDTATTGKSAPAAPGKEDSSLPKVEAPKIDAPASKDDASKDDASKHDGSKSDASKSDEKGDPSKGDASKDKAKTAGVKLNADEIAEVKKLPANEQDAALAQVVCPVSDEHLGTMGVPIKVSAEGKTFYLCCKGCKKEVDAHPKDVLAKLPPK
ncbi:MAG: hypothetical protein NVSMB9_25040 [Isosphaeraceae bacterium]